MTNSKEKNGEARSLHEINQYKDPAFPVGVYSVTCEGIMPEGRGYRDLHWHEELQFTYVDEGSLNMRVDGKDYQLKKEEAIFINRNLLHITTNLSEDGQYRSLNFPDKILGFFPGSRMEQDCVIPYTRSYGLATVVLKRDVDWQAEILEDLKQILELLRGERIEIFEYRVSVAIINMWIKFVTNISEKMIEPTKGYIRKQERIHTMLSFIHENYMNEIHLKEIARSANVSVGECCRCFQSMVKNSPNQYLMEYRISKGKELLRGSKLSVTEVAYMVGFNDSSYFIQNFKKSTGVTPGEYANEKC